MKNDVEKFACPMNLSQPTACGMDAGVIVAFSRELIAMCGSVRRL